MKINTPDNIVQSFSSKLYALSTKNKYRLLEDLRKYPQCHSVFLFGENVHYTDLRDAPDVEEIKTYLRNNGHTSIGIEEISPAIEDCFMELMTQKSITNA
jgi:hypothetical protein